MGAPLSLDVGGQQVSVTNPDKVVFPDFNGRPSVTKLDLINYYLAVADGALRGVANRPMILKRFVKGITEEAVFQKRAPEKRPDYVDVAELKYASGTSAKEVVIHAAPGLAWAINMGCIDLNPHPVQADDLAHPDELRVDLDPMPGVDWKQIVDVALVAREVLEDHGLTGWPKTSGSRGFHIYAPIQPRWPFKFVRLAAQTVAREVERRVPELATERWWKEEQGRADGGARRLARTLPVGSRKAPARGHSRRRHAGAQLDLVPDTDQPAARAGGPAAAAGAAAGRLQPLGKLLRTAVDARWLSSLLLDPISVLIKVLAGTARRPR